MIGKRIQRRREIHLGRFALAISFVIVKLKRAGLGRRKELGPFQPCRFASVVYLSRAEGVVAVGLEELGKRGVIAENLVGKTALVVKSI